MPIKYGWKPCSAFTDLSDTPDSYEGRECQVKVKADLTGVEFSNSYYPEADTFAELPDAAEWTGRVYLVKVNTGTWLINRKRAGLWYSDGVSWERLGTLPTCEEMGAIATAPPDGSLGVTNLYVDPEINKTTVIFKDAP